VAKQTGGSFALMSDPRPGGQLTGVDLSTWG
jgi:hypothetical protein